MLVTFKGKSLLDFSICHWERQWISTTSVLREITQLVKFSVSYGCQYGNEIEVVNVIIQCIAGILTGNFVVGEGY